MLIIPKKIENNSHWKVQLINYVINYLIDNNKHVMRPVQILFLIVSALVIYVAVQQRDPNDFSVYDLHIVIYKGFKTLLNDVFFPNYNARYDYYEKRIIESKSILLSIPCMAKSMIISRFIFSYLPQIIMLFSLLLFTSIITIPAYIVILLYIFLKDICLVMFVGISSVIVYPILFLFGLCG